MMLIDGKKIAQEIQADIAARVAQIQGRKPGLTFIIVGDNPASQTYVQAKKKACNAVGIASTIIELPKTVSETDLLKQIDQLNRDPFVDGILVQLPLPLHIEEKIVTAAIDPNKDVDGFHPLNMGKTLLGEEDTFFPCTPYGIKTVLERSHIQVEGKHVVIVGRSNIVGKPLAAILMQKKAHCNATVTVAHSQSENLSELTRSADILVAAIGRPLFIKKEMVKPGSTVIDVGINRLADRTLVGDVDFAAVSPLVSHITPVPGGIGPMTIAMLLQNTLRSFLKLALFLLLFISCQKEEPSNDCTQFQGTALESSYHIAIGKKISEKERAKVQQLIDQTFEEVSALFDHQNPSSEVTKLNQASSETLIPLSRPMQDLLALCDQLVTLTGGRFDPTVEPLYCLWQATKSPSADDLQLACDALGWHHVSIHNGIYRKDHPATRLALRAIGKGVCIDWITERLQQLGYSDLMVEWAGKIRAIGHHPANRDWTVQIDPGLKKNNQSIAPIPLRNCAVATSGNYPLQIIDPLSASPLEKTKHSIAYVAVIAPSCALADGLATASLVFHTRKEAEAFAQEVVTLHPDVSFWILSRDGH